MRLKLMKKNDKITASINMLVSMMIRDRAYYYKTNRLDELKRFRKSKTYKCLYDIKTGLWLNGPSYLMNEYEKEIKK